MANPARALMRRRSAAEQQRDGAPWPTLPGGVDPYLSLTQASSFGYGGLDYAIQPNSGVTLTQQGNRVEEIGADFNGFADAYRGNAVIYGCIKSRLLVFPEARFQFRQRRQ